MNIDHTPYYTGIPLIDNQHEQYLRLVDDLFTLCEQPHVDHVTAEKCLGRVLAYAIEHFDAEEALMLSMQYRGYESHQKKHNEFRDEADQLHAMFKEDVDLRDHLIRLTKLLVEWFYEQTVVYDKALATFLKRQQ